MTHSRPTVHRLLDEHGLAARRELGQNFVADPNTVRRIAQLADVGPGDFVVEIGPGLGSLTLALVETGAEVVAIEVDPGMAAVAAEVVGDSARIIEADAQTLDWDALLARVDGPVHVVANLPYNIGTTLIIDILEHVPRVERLLVLVQTEVAHRLAAEVGSRTYGIPSVLVALHGAATIAGHVPPSVFVPKPKVDSALVRIIRHAEPPVDVRSGALSEVVKAGFGQRRKMLRRSLKSMLTEAEIESAGVDPTRRAEELDLAAWAELARLLPEME